MLRCAIVVRIEKQTDPGSYRVESATAVTNGSSESAVYERYAAASREVEPALCCPVEYAAEYLAAIPQEIIDKDYGCGDPTPYVDAGETVLDLGSGAGKLCFMLSQKVGPQGRVIGVDCNTEMLSLARKHQPVVAGTVGYSNVDFRYGMIQDLQLDLARLDEQLDKVPIRTSADWIAARSTEDKLRREQPLIADDSIDCIVSNCVLNLVRQQDRRQLFGEMFRVLKRGGRAAISDIVSDETVPEHLQQDGRLWSGCLSGAFREDEFLEAFAAAGFHGMKIVNRQSEPWQTIEGIEFRSVTVVAYKGKQGPCLERNQALIYKGPFRKIEDDDGHAFVRGDRMAVCDKTFRLLQQPPYEGHFEPVEPREQIPVEQAAEFDCRRSKRRDPRETKGTDYRETVASDDACCGDDGSCC
ncbi:MAG: methyltransferase domain-containing protein [Planctomycetaceae bacterium]|nr:methyltransferase domain-containing protein [Planctomycetaceae bacterium]